GCAASATSMVPAQHQLLTGLTAAELERLLPALETLHAEPGTQLVRTGDSAEELFLVVAGALSVYAPGQGGRGRRLSTLSAGMTFGEAALVQRGPRTADAFADSEVGCLPVSYSLLDRFPPHGPVPHAKLPPNILP